MMCCTEGELYPNRPVPNMYNVIKRLGLVTSPPGQFDLHFRNVLISRHLRRQVEGFAEVEWLYPHQNDRQFARILSSILRSLHWLERDERDTFQRNREHHSRSCGFYSYSFYGLFFFFGVGIAANPLFNAASE